MLPYYLAYGACEYFKLKFFGGKAPFGCSLAPTIECNLSCKHCYERKNRISGKKELTLEEIDRLQNDPDYLEEKARKDYGMLKENETLYIFKKKK